MTSNLQLTIYDLQFVNIARLRAAYMFDLRGRGWYGARMKRACLIASLLVPCLAAWSLATAADTAEPAGDSAAAQQEGKGKKKAGKAHSPMARALGKVKYYTTAKPHLDAKYFIFLFSTSNCTHCHRTMPGNVDLYKEMRRQGDVELMLVTLTNLDNAEAALGFLNKYNAPFAGATDTEMRAAGVPVIDKVNAGGPGSLLALPPHIVIVDKSGKLVFQGPASVEGRNTMEDWRQYTGGKPAAKKGKAKKGK